MAQRKRRSQARKPQRQTPGWVLAGGGVLAGLAIATLLFIGGVIDTEAPLQTGGNQASNASAPTTHNDTADERSQETEYTFYEQLPNARPSAPPSEPVVERRNDEREYLVQAGSFKKFEDAESLKAQLAFLGLAAQVEPVEVEDTRVYRVVLGPYDSRRNADQVQRQLRENQYDALLRSQPRG
jgi:cell division protein FtsN